MKRPVEVEDLEVQPQVKNSTTDKTQAKGNFSETSSLNNPPKKQKRTTLDKEGSGRKTFEVWDHFSEITSKVGEVKAKCKYCFKDFKWTSKNGTSNLWGHLLTKCTKYPFKSFDKKQRTLKPIKRGGTVDLEKIVYNVTEVRRAIAEFVIIDEQPFRVVEGEGFKRLISFILSNYELPSRITVARQCLKIYQEEKQKLKRLVKGEKIEHPSSEDWRDVNVFLKFLEIFYQTTLKFSSTLHVTSKTFFHELFNLQSIIVNYSKCDDSLLTCMTKKMKGKFDKYWGDFDDMNMLVFVAVVLDLRFKMKYVKFIFKNYYNSVEGCSKSTKVTDTLTSLYNHYKNSIVGTSCETVGDQTDSVSEVSAMDTSDVRQSQWEKFLEKENNNVDDKFDLDKYLEDDVEKIKDFNILTWWKASSERYPIVSRIARDILAIPTSTFASESVFSTGDRILDCYRGSLSPKTAEALVCSQQWLHSAST
ncbi:hypothetical protein KY285_033346 [Solanum tuberosum]|nr:hypothetical protein KY285_033346 [Solanum tuberosum]